MEQESTLTASVNPIDMTVTVTYRIHSFKALAEDIAAAAKIFADLPSDIITRKAANAMIDKIFANVAAKQVEEVKPAEAAKDEDLGTDAHGNQIY